MNAPALNRPRYGLVADIGGTHARFALAQISGVGATISRPASLPARDYKSPCAAAAAYLAAEPERPGQLDFAVFACAGPVQNDAVTLTNLDWSVDRAQIEHALNVTRARVINDLEAAVLAAPRLSPQDARQIGGPETGQIGGVIAVVGAGTGFNAAALVRLHDGGQTVIGGEAGHAGFAPVGALEIEIATELEKRFGHVSVERVLSGPGILHIYQALAAIKGAPEKAASPAEVSDLAAAGDPLAGQALRVFCEALGSAAANLALTFGARGGVYIAGGIAPNLISMLASGGFRARFEAKAPMESYLKAIPTSVITQPYAALMGAAEAMTAIVQEIA
jgi:glucokinase